MQRGVAPGDGDARPAARECARCGGALRGSHREYAGGGRSVLVLRCASCGATVTGAARADADRQRAAGGRSRRHQPVDEGPPSNPVLDPDLARRLLDELDG